MLSLSGGPRTTGSRLPPTLASRLPHRLHPPGFLVAACVGIAGVSLTLGTVGPLLPRFDAAMHSGLYTGLVIAGHPIGSFAAAVPTLLASRRFGLSRVIAAGAAVAVAASVLFVWPGAGWWIVVARVGYGAAGTLVWQSIFAWTVANSGPGRRARTMGLLLAASTAGMLVGPQVGALADRFGLWICALPPLLLVAAAARFAAMPAYEMLERPDLGRLRQAFLSRDGLAGSGLIAGGALLQLAVTTSLPLALHRNGIGAFGIGAVLTGAYAALIALNPLAGRISDLGRTRLLLCCGLVLLALGLAGLALAPSAAVAVPFALACACVAGIPGFTGGVLASRAVASAAVDQTVWQTTTTLAWGPAAIAGSVGAGAAGASDAALLGLAAVAAVGAAVAATELVHVRHRARLAV